MMNDEDWVEVTEEDHDGADWVPVRDPLGEPLLEEAHHTETQIGGCDGPYVLYSRVVTYVVKRHNKMYDQNADCKCGHSYYRHFDTYENMLPVGCKYCECTTFEPKEVFDRGTQAPIQLRAAPTKQ